MNPCDALEAAGFPNSNDTIGAFNYPSFEDSYSSLGHAETRNVGVIEITFTLKGVNPWTWMPEEACRREEAASA